MRKTFGPLLLLVFTFFVPLTKAAERPTLDALRERLQDALAMLQQNHETQQERHHARYMDELDALKQRATRASALEVVLQIEQSKTRLEDTGIIGLQPEAHRSFAAMQKAAIVRVTQGDRAYAQQLANLFQSYDAQLGAAERALTQHSRIPQAIRYRNERARAKEHANFAWAREILANRTPLLRPGKQTVQLEGLKVHYPFDAAPEENLVADRSGGNYTGLVDEFMAFDRALNAEDVQALYQRFPK